VPSTIDAFRTHASFVLDRHIPRYQAVRPGAAKAGMHRWAYLGGGAACHACAREGAAAGCLVSLPGPTTSLPPYTRTLPRGEAYFRRCDLADLHSADQWRREQGREVLPGELGRPYKRVKKRGAGKPAATSWAAASQSQEKEEEEEEVGGGGVRGGGGLGHA
jgi:xeroderma pigmentosum group C-complementing protein